MAVAAVTGFFEERSYSETSIRIDLGEQVVVHWKSCKSTNSQRYRRATSCPQIFGGWGRLWPPVAVLVFFPLCFPLRRPNQMLELRLNIGR
jgi:hypothetical protein